MSTQTPSVEIPLNKIWARSMPGTKDIRTLEPDHFGLAVQQLPEQQRVDLLYSSLSQQIDFAIGRRSEKKQPIGPGFAVAGTGHKALVATKEVMDQEQMPSQVFSSGRDVSLFFFTRLYGRPVNLKSIVMSDNTITIRYQYAPYIQNKAYATISYRHFALIPLGKLPVGSYTVNIVQSPLERKYKIRGFIAVSKEVGEKHVCKSFAFSVAEDGNEASNDE